MYDRLLAGFKPFEADVDGARIAGRSAGFGLPILLLNGYPQTRMRWHQVAPILAERGSTATTAALARSSSGRLPAKTGPPHHLS
ncbi:hypothetical protein [Nonomuraea basaltis]|uniref:hypothetical protein n=1 Tax=Nonomuraea basaltis TaxID=2495887 RepID=UPI00110C4B9D|nr:hypothetical protein [Nonomuraea basaltis]TMR98410.1 hypothetical protein EJK15_12685 [Nonomuraea basaltis]